MLNRLELKGHSFIKCHGWLSNKCQVSTASGSAEKLLTCHFLHESLALCAPLLLCCAREKHDAQFEMCWVLYRAAGVQGSPLSAKLSIHVSCLCGEGHQRKYCYGSLIYITSGYWQGEFYRCVALLNCTVHICIDFSAPTGNLPRQYHSLMTTLSLFRRLNNGFLPCKEMFKQPYATECVASFSK